MRICICAGHTLKGKGTGAEGYINESKENRILSKKIVEYLKKFDNIECDYYEINEANDYLQKQVAFANKKDYDVVVQVHFNANKTISGPVGTEVLYSTNRGKPFADRVVKELATLYKNRGSKKRTDLYWLNKTNSPAILIETCFVDSKSDTNIYKNNIDNTAKVIAEGIVNKKLPITTQQASTKTFFRVVAGSYEDRKLAEEQQNKLKMAGFDSFLVAYKK